MPPKGTKPDVHLFLSLRLNPFCSSQMDTTTPFPPAEVLLSLKGSVQMSPLQKATLSHLLGPVEQLQQEVGRYHGHDASVLERDPLPAVPWSLGFAPPLLGCGGALSRDRDRALLVCCLGPGSLVGMAGRVESHTGQGVEKVANGVLRWAPRGSTGTAPNPPPSARPLGPARPRTRRPSA
jgi:hypothetical protein